MSELWRSILRSAVRDGARSSILAPVNVTLAITLGGLIGMVEAVGHPLWLLIGGAVAILLELLLIVYGFIVALNKNPDLLRSERYNVTKMAIEKSQLGDDRIGLRDLLVAVAEPNDELLPAPSPADKEDDK